MAVTPGKGYTVEIHWKKDTAGCHEKLAFVDDVAFQPGCFGVYIVAEKMWHYFPWAELGSVIVWEDVPDPSL